MSDFEERVRRGLASGADPGEWDAPSLVAGAERRARRRRRRRRTTAVLVAATLAPILVLAGFVHALGEDNHDHQDGRPATGVDRSVTDAPIADGWRYEYADGLEFMVPEGWGLGSRTTWCANARPMSGHPRGAAVQRPSDRNRHVTCSPAATFGVTVGSGAAISLAHPSGHVWQYDADEADIAMYPDGAWLGYWYSGDRLVQVASADRKTTQRIVDSVRPLLHTSGPASHEEEVETPNGCPVRSAADPLLEMAADTGGPLTVCRFTSESNGTATMVPGSNAWQDTYLTQAVALSQQEAGALRAAVAEASSAGSRDCLRIGGDLVLVLAGGVPAYRIWQPCGTDLVQAAEATKAVTPEVVARLHLPALELAPRR